MNRQLFRLYINLNLRAVKINSNKVPLDRWKETECAEYEKNALYAFVIPKGILVIDVDVKNNQPGLESFERFKRDTISESITHNVTTGSGGYHYYCHFPSDLPLLNAYACKQVYPGIDFLQQGQLVIGAEQKLDNGEYILNPSKGLNLNYGIDYKSNSNLVFKGDLAFHKSFGKTIGSDLSDLTSSLDYSNISLEQIKACLDLVDSSDYFLWIKVGMALYQHLGDEGFPLFLEWSKKSDKFKSEHEAMTKWKSFNQKDPSIENAVTFGTLHYHALETKLNNLVLEIKQCKDKDSVKKVLRNEKYTSYPKFKNEHILSTIPKYLRKLEPFQKYTPTQLKDFCIDALKTKEDVSFETSRKEELNELIFNNIVKIKNILNKNCYKNIITDQNYDNGSLKKIIEPYKQELQELYNVKNFTPETALTKDLIQEIDYQEYDPSKKERIYKDRKGHIVFNKYNYKAVPPLIPTMTPEGERFKKVLLDAEVFLGKENLHILFNIYRYYIDHPGKKIRWMLVIYGFQGLGKNLLLEALASVTIGFENYGTLSNTNLNSQYNGWVREKQLRIVPELKMSEESYNNFKTAVTDEVINITEKYETSSVIKNRTNFIGCSNFKNCIPLAADDRRYALIFAKVENEIDLNVALQARGYKDNEEYNSLLDKIKHAPMELAGQLRYFISQYPYSPDFDPYKIKFKNDKAAVRQASLERNANNSVILDIIESIYNEKFPSFLDFKLIQNKYSERYINQQEYGLMSKLSPYKIKKIITSFGYIEYKTWFYLKTYASDEAKKYIENQKNSSENNKLDTKETDSLLTEIGSQKKSIAERIKEITDGIKFRK